LRESGPIEVRGVSRTYRTPAGSTEALHAVDATFAPGTITALVGPSGSGKTTLLRLLAGLDQPDRGTIVFAGTDLASLGAKGRRRYRRTSSTYLAQRAAANLVTHLTLREQLDAGGRALAESLGLADRLDGHTGELSGGQQARAALAVGLSRTTAVVLVDEPTAELDQQAADLAVGALERAARDGRTVVVATHDPDLIARAASVVDLSGSASETARGARPSPSSVLEGTAIAARGVTKRYGETFAITRATLEVAPGELAVLLGRSGSGKSTLLMALGGFVSADEGEIETPGTRWHETAYVAQRFGLLGELSVSENVDLPARLGGRSQLDVLAALDLAALADRLPSETSVGQQQRTALARAVAGRPRAVLADEPTSHQDAASAERVWAALAEACADGTACLVATHDEHAAERAHRVWRVEDGHVRPG
jgi:ABC-type lipoprotein export system ATPase subunit